MELIDKDALVAEIERLMTPECGYSMNKLIDFLESLEVKEVDLDKEISFQWSKFCLNSKDRNSFVNIVKHFFELGLKAQKGG